MSDDYKLTLTGDQVNMLYYALRSKRDQHIRLARGCKDAMAEQQTILAAKAEDLLRDIAVQIKQTEAT